MKAWINIDNPPQVQYLLPFVGPFERLGLEVHLTTRDYGITTELLEALGVDHHTIGRELGGSRAAKASGTITRALRLVAHLRRSKRPLLLIGASRSATLAAWTMRVPSFTVVDYEHAELRSFRALGTTVLHPEVIDAAIFREKGFAADKLVAFAGTKEDITFGSRDIDAVVPHDFAVPRDQVALVLVRPPSETSHYFNPASRDLTTGVLARLAADPTVRVVFSPRHPEQARGLRSYRWTNEPIVLGRAIEFVSLLKAVDWVVCAGGTMLREAAFLGVPAISILQSQIGAVDRRLEESGSVLFVSRPEDLDVIDWLNADRSEEPVIRHHASVAEDLARQIVDLATAQRRR